MKLLAKFVLILFPVWAQAQITIDGVISPAEMSYYRLLASANNNNGFGTGNDIGALYYYSDVDELYLGITGTVEANASVNNIVLFMDFENYNGRGVNTIAGNTNSGGVGVFTMPSSCLGPSTMDSGFDLDYAFAFNKGDGAIPNIMYLDAIRFGTNSGSEYLQFGTITCQLNGISTTSTIPICNPVGSCTPTTSIEFAFLDGFSTINLFRGVELRIPYSSLPTVSAGQRARFFVLITNQYGLPSNECMPGDLGTTSPLPGCGFNFSNVADEIFYTYPDVILPLSFLNNTAKWNNGQALLQWTVAQDFEALQYTIERSANGTSFTTIGTVAAQQVKDFASYIFTDNNPLRGKNFYRIKAIRRNGEPKYSQQATLENTGGSFCIYPNPASGEVTLYGPGLPKGVYPVLISNITGQVVHRSAIYHSSGSLHTTLSLPSLPAGIYSLQLGNDRQLTAQRLVIE